jgi:lactonase
MKKTMLACLAFAGGFLAYRSLSTKQERSVVPLPPELKTLPVTKAEPWLQVDERSITLEGPAFDRNGNLFCSAKMDNALLKITPDKNVTGFFREDGFLPLGLAFHKNGRLYALCTSGRIISMDGEGKIIEYLETIYHGKTACPNDLVFDSRGNLYVTDFSGHVGNPIGGVYRYSDEFRKIESVLEGLAGANGIGLNPAENQLWVAETGRSQLLNIRLEDDGVTIRKTAGISVAYRFTGGHCDSMAIDVDGNVYQAVNMQGRVVVFNKRGLPIANVLIPGRDEGKHLVTTNVAFKPGTDEAYITLSGRGGAWIYKFKGLTKGLPLFAEK